MPENGGTFYDVHDVIIVKGKLLRLLKNKQETIRYFKPSFIIINEHAYILAIY